MKKIPSFTIDHERLDRGVFVSRRDVTPAGDELTTFDIRMTLPNREPALDGATIHTIEHLAATYLRNHSYWGPRTIYWGPMGCLTGNYLILQGHLDPVDILPLLREMFQFIATYEGDVPGATPRDCGNYRYMDLPSARTVARRYLTEVLTSPAPSNLNYPLPE